MQKSVIQTVADKYLSSDASTILFIDDKDILCSHGKPQRRFHQPYANCSNQVTIHLVKTFKQSLMASVGESQVTAKEL